jgi:hypothetical protein
MGGRVHRGVSRGNELRLKVYRHHDQWSEPSRPTAGDSTKTVRPVLAYE